MDEWTAFGLARLSLFVQRMPPWLARLTLAWLIPVNARFSIPRAHRRWLLQQEQEFSNEILALWPQGRFSKLRLWGWEVLPFVDLLNRPGGGRAYCGGPLFRSGEPLFSLRHFRGTHCIDHPLWAQDFVENRQWRHLQGRAFWCGPLCHHFGHQVADFGSRVLLASLDLLPGQLLWQRFGPGSNAPLKVWQRELLTYLNPGRKIIHWQKHPLLVQELVVIPQQARMRAAPTLRHLAALSWLQRSLPVDTNAPVIYVSRSRFSSCRSAETLLGGFAAEHEFEQLLEQRGVVVVHPQDMTLTEQLSIYRSAKCAIISEGSAQHGFELLGFDGKKQLLVICRRPQQTGMQLPLQARFPRVQFLDAVTSLWKSVDGESWNGLAVIDYNVVSESLQPLGLTFSEADLSQLELAAKNQLAELSTVMPLVRCSLSG